MCPVGFLMTETAVGIRCAGERPESGGKGEVEWHLLPRPQTARVQHLGERGREACNLRIYSPCYHTCTRGQEQSWDGGDR